MGRIINKQTIIYLVLVITVAIFAGLSFIIWRDSMSISDTRHQPPSVPPTRGEAGTKTRNTRHETPDTKIQDSKIQVDTQKTLSKIKYEELFEKAPDFEEDDENIISTGE